MKILFGSNYGKDTSELESGYLVWIIEKYDKADWQLINACKSELSARLKLDWTPKSNELRDLETALKLSTKQVDTLLKQNDHLFKVIALSTICKGNEHILQSYLDNPNYADEIIGLIKC